MSPRGVAPPVSRREQLVCSRTRCKNEIHAVLMRRLQGRCPHSDMFGKAGRQWLRSLKLRRSSHDAPNRVP